MAVRLLKLTDKVEILHHPVDQKFGFVSDIKVGVPYPYYLTSEQEWGRDKGQKNDLGPYSAEQLELVA